MAKVKSNYLSEIRGSLGKDLNFRLRRNCIDLSRQRKPSNPNTPAQREQRLKYGIVVQEWRDLPQQDKEQWNEDAKILNISGWNYFLKTRITDPTLLGVPLLESFESYALNTEVPTDYRWDAYYSNHTPQVNTKKVASDQKTDGLQSYFIHQHLKRSGSNGYFIRVALTRTKEIRPKFHKLTFDVHCAQCFASGPETWASAVFGLIVIYVLNNNTRKAIGYNTHRESGSTQVLYYYWDGAFRGADISVQFDKSFNVWHTINRNLKTDFNSNFAEDFDTDVKEIYFALSGTGQTSQTTGDQIFKGWFDNIRFEEP